MTTKRLGPTSEKLREALGALRGLPRVLRLAWTAHPAYAAAVVALSLLQGVQPVLTIWLTKAVVDVVAAAVERRSALTEGLLRLPDLLSVPSTIWLVTAAALLTLIGRIVEPAATLAQQQLGDYLTRRLHRLILEKANSLQDAAPFENPRFYDALSRAQDGIDSRPLNILLGVVGLVRTITQLLGLAVLLASVQPLLVPAALLLAVPALVLQFQVQLDAFALASQTTPEVRRMRYFAEVVTGQATAKEIRLFGLGEYFVGRYLAELDAFRRRFNTLRRRFLRRDLPVSVLTTIAGWVPLVVLVAQAMRRSLSLGDLTLATQALWQARAQTTAAVGQLTSLYGHVLFVTRLFEFLDRPPSLVVLPPGEAAPPPAPLRWGIELRAVSFVYPGSAGRVLDRVTLRVLPGECVAVVGENGAGKTTLVKLLGRLYDPTEGQILVDGVDLRLLDLDEWRRQLAAVFQDFGRYVGSAQANVGIGYVPKADDLAAVRAAAERGGAAALIESLPRGYDTTLGRWVSPDGVDGVELSGGEWQRVALSRAFMRTPSAGAYDGYEGAQLLILDEPTAALDTESEYDAYRRFRELTRGRATILISHRFSTVKMADRIVVLEHGRITEDGTHSNLVERGGVYADLYEKQASRYR